MKFEIKNRFTGDVQFEAEIDCTKDTAYSVQLGLAVRFAISRDASLRGADLRDADLSYADLRDASLRGADLRDANLGNTDLSDADLSYADLSHANLGDANLYGADLSYANLSDADLSGASLTGVRLYGANLYGADLRDANIWNTIGDRLYLKTMQIDTYSVSYTHDMMQIGCHRHLITEWWNFDDSRIIEMEGKRAAEWWKIWKPILQQIIATSPAAVPELKGGAK